jgi:carbonic anhydrase
MPATQTIIITCLDHRTDPAIYFGLKVGDAPVLRNAGGRVSQSIIEEIAYLAFLGRRIAGGAVTPDMSVEVAVIHHNQCGTGFLADPDFRREASQATGVSEDALLASVVDDPHATVAVDVKRLLSSPLLPPGMFVSSHVYDVETGAVTTVVPARRPE